MLWLHKNWIIINFIDDETDDVDYKHINKTILDVSATNIYWIIYKGNLGRLMLKTHSVMVTTL